MFGGSELANAEKLNIKKPYEPPTVTSYGTVRDLTQKSRTSRQIRQGLRRKVSHKPPLAVNFFYRFFGFSVASICPIPGLTPSPARQCDLRILLSHAPPLGETKYSKVDTLKYTSGMTNEFGEPAFHIFMNSDQTVARVKYVDGMQFWIDAAEGAIWFTWPEPLTTEDAAAYLLGPVLGLFLRLRGTVCLHASAVVMGGGAVLFSGDPVAGKSTTAAALTRRGYPLLSDDIVAIVERGGEYFAMPAYPYVSLCGLESPAMLGSERAILPEISPTLSKHRFAPAVFYKSDALLRRVFILGERGAGAEFPRIEEMSPQRRMMALVANSYGTTVMDQENRVREFAFLGRLLRDVFVLSLCANSDPQLLDRLCDVIEAACV